MYPSVLNEEDTIPIKGRSMEIPQNARRMVINNQMALNPVRMTTSTIPHFKARKPTFSAAATERWLQRNLSSKVLFDTMKTRIKVAGNSLIRAGDVVELFLPKTGPIDETTNEWYDKRASGKYLVASVRHIIVGDEYNSVLMLVKNKYEEPIPDQATFLGSSNKNDSNLMRSR